MLNGGNMEVITELKQYTPYNEQEQMDQVLMLQFLSQIPMAYHRSNTFGHMTCSPWIVNTSVTKALMVHHNIYQSWGWCGGHSDGEHNLLEKAIAEGKEETGLTKLQACCQAIFAIDVLPVYAHRKNERFVSSHIHLNVTYLCMADEHSPLHCKYDENSGVRWVAFDEIDSLVCEEHMLPIYHKLVEKSLHYMKGVHKTCNR